jgi:hypothetical protein
MRYVKLNNSYVNLDKVRVFFIKETSEDKFYITIYYDNNTITTEATINKEILERLLDRAYSE